MRRGDINVNCKMSRNVRNMSAGSWHVLCVQSFGSRHSAARFVGLIAASIPCTLFRRVEARIASPGASQMAVLHAQARG